jgi:hypothetical protein
MTEHDTVAWRCRLLAAAAWIVTAGWFCFVLVLAWGGMLPSLVLWVPIAFLLARQTRRWLTGADRRGTGTGLLIVAPLAVLAVAIVFPVQSSDWRQRLAWILLYATVGISALGVAVSLLGGFGRASSDRAPSA